MGVWAVVGAETPALCARAGTCTVVCRWRPQALPCTLLTACFAVSRALLGRDHCNNWDQGGVFFDLPSGAVWGQPNYWAGKMLADSHQPNVVRVSVDYNASFLPTPTPTHTPTPTPTPTPVPPEYDVPRALDAHASVSTSGKHVSIRVVNPLPLPIQARVRFRKGSFAAGSITKATILTSESLADDNTLDNQQRVVPRPFVLALASGGAETEPAWFPGHSFVSITLVARSAADPNPNPNSTGTGV